jgi:hypothetical protein
MTKPALSEPGSRPARTAIRDEFGYAVSLSDNGIMIVVGAWSNDGKNGMD